jgi:hypothetical protein
LKSAIALSELALIYAAEFNQIAGETLKPYSVLDRIGITAACVCATHCIVTPLLVALLPLASIKMFADERTEWAFLGLTMVIGVASLLPGYFRHHRRKGAVSIFVAGIVLILAARLMLEESVMESSLVVTGALFVAAAHIINRVFCRACISCRAEM